MTLLLLICKTDNNSSNYYRKSRNAPLKDETAAAATPAANVTYIEVKLTSKKCMSVM
jgi:hypothetical protein